MGLYAEVISVGWTSTGIAVEAWRHGRKGKRRAQVTRAVFTFIAIDAKRRPRAVSAPGTAAVRGTVPAG